MSDPEDRFSCVAACMLFNLFQLICNAVLLSGANMFGVYHKYLTDITHRHTFLEARKSIESMVKLEKEKKEQVHIWGQGIAGFVLGGGRGGRGWQS